MRVRLPEVLHSTGRLLQAPVIAETAVVNRPRSSRQAVAVPSRVPTNAELEGNLTERLFDNKASLKVLTSQISMHLEQVQRSDIFKQIDELLAAEDWADDSVLVNVQSFRTFLRFLTYESKVKRPSLSVSATGNIMASWVLPVKRLTMEFQLRDTVRLVAHSKNAAGEGESLAYVGSLKRIDAILAPFEAAGWYREAT